MTGYFRFRTPALALLFLALHAISLPRSLEDIDSINFALGVESFDVASHRPHPPGYPVFVALGKVSTAVVAAVAPAASRNERAAAGLAIWGVASGTVFAWVLVALWRTLGWSPAAAWFAAALAIVSPLFWFTSARPLTDASALVGAVAVQAALARHLLMATRQAGHWRVVQAAAFLTGLLVGLRTQTLWLTAPLLTWIVAQALWQRRLGDAARLVMIAAAGCLVWAVPLLWSTGGLAPYLAALAHQGGEDFAGVRMLATAGDATLVADAIASTFVRPWRVAWLGQGLSGLALVGLVRLGLSRRREAGLLLVAFAPYLAFHLAFQETETVRYALPIVVPMAGLAVYALFWLPAKFGGTVAALVSIASLITAYPALAAYGRNVPPTFQAYRDAETRALQQQPSPLVVPHEGIRRVADWYRPEWPALPVITPAEPSWLRVVDHFRSGATNPVWFLTDRRRTDVVLFDRRYRHVVGEYLQEAEVRRLVGQARQDEVRWWQVEPPGWMLGRGWALSPEAAGLTFARGRDPYLVPADAYLRRTPAPSRLMIGGRYLSGTRPGVIVVELDGRAIGRHEVAPGGPPFLHWIDLPAGALTGEGAYATLTVRVEGAGEAGAAPQVGLEQFDFARADDVMAGFGDGWFEPETDAETGRSWRWAGPRATMVVYGGAGGVRLTMEGESPLRYYERPSTISVSIDGRPVAQFTADADFVRTIDIPADRWGSLPAHLVVDTDQAFVPADRGVTGDQRRLALRFFRVDAGR